MKTILLWDPRFVARAPQRLILDDALAAVAVRAGVAAAADPAEQGELAAGAPLDPGQLTEVVVAEGHRRQLARVFLPASVVAIGAGLGLVAAIGVPFAGGVTPPPAPSPTVLTLANLPSGYKAFEFDPATGVTQSAGNVSAWAAKTGGITLTPAAGTPTYNVVDGKPAIVLDGVATTGAILSGSNPPFETGALFLVAKRGLVAGSDGSAPTGRTVMRFGRQSDSLQFLLGTFRKSADADTVTPKQVRVFPPGSGSAGALSLPTFWQNPAKSIITVQSMATQTSAEVNGGAMSNRTSSASVGATTAAALTIGGDVAQVNDRQGMEIGYLLGTPSSAIPEFGYVGGMAGNPPNAWHAYVIEGMLAWEHGTVAQLRADHPFKLRAPYLSELWGWSGVVQTWGNSICAGTTGQIALAGAFAAKGLVAINGGVGGDTTTQIRDRFLAGFNTGTGTTDSASTTVQRQRTTVIGEFFVNGPGDTSGTDADRQNRMFADLGVMVAAIETAQGVAAGGARLRIWEPWITWNAPIGSANRISADALDDRLTATYPNYRAPISTAFIAAGAPGGTSPDPTNFALGIPPAAYKEADPGTLHPNTALGYPALGAIVHADLLASAWVA